MIAMRRHDTASNHFESLLHPQKITTVVQLITIHQLHLRNQFLFFFVAFDEKNKSRDVEFLGPEQFQNAS
jgi:hypothetical protein